MSMNENRDRSGSPLISRKWLIGFGVFALILIVSIWAMYIYNFGRSGISPSREVWGQFGDFVGGTVNSILSFLTFVGLLYTIFIQQQELRDTREELKGARIEAERQNQHFSCEALKSDLRKDIEYIDKLITQLSESISAKSIHHKYSNLNDVIIYLASTNERKDLMCLNFIDHVGKFQKFSDVIKLLSALGLRISRLNSLYPAAAEVIGAHIKYGAFVNVIVDYLGKSDDEGLVVFIDIESSPKR